MYPTLLFKTVETSMLFNGISPRTIGIDNNFPFRKTFTKTSLPFVPRRVFIANSLVIFLPVKLDLLTEIILSPAIIPALADGPPFIACKTHKVSLMILNSTPIPSKFPSILSVSNCKSSAEM